MAAPKSSTRGHPGRALVFITVVIAALYAIMFATGDTTPRLGIDLAGGTSVTLKAKPDQGVAKNAVNADNMNTAVSIIRDRVNAFGVSEAEVQTQGSDHIVINIPKGKGEKEAAAQVGQTAKLYFRPVLAADRQPVTQPQPQTTPPASPTPSAAPSNPAQGQAAASTPPATTPASASSSATGTAKPTATGSSTAKATATASTTSKPQGRVIPNLKDATTPPPTPTANPPGSPAPDITQQPFDMTQNPGAANNGTGQQNADLSAFGVTPELQAQYNALDCSDPAKRGTGQQTNPTLPTVACERKPQDGTIEKYILGPAAIDGTDLSSSKATLPPQGQAGGWEVALKFDGKGTGKFTNITKALSSSQYPTNRFAVELDGVVQVAPTVNQELPGGEAVITGQFSQKEAKGLANVLKFGALPLSFEQSEVSTVSAALGSDQLKGGLIAGAIGLFLVALYSIMYYRGLGFVSLISLGISALLTYAIMCLLGRGIGFALNLPAICGAIAAIGITADSFIVYFERIRDEIREGKSLQPAVARAWPRARRTILVSDAVSFLAAAILYWVSVGKVKGFAFTLGLTTLLDIVVVFLFTKPLMVILARKGFFASGHPWSGLDPKRLGAKRPLAYRATRRRPGTAEPKEA
ncbi:protein translocase subunit SecD [Yinghuangia seranimata]|uniref:protein translocase subunit SecD n=1 Tax=Yinghuangia seranimata TaxID=408067 RepID=UPI00248CACB4|nr:protein translocase subunit SecD [Yinghuangia seranimata]MDI2132716.1 protein translocase subunit SecD [Yinghuangia seranimata]